MSYVWMNRETANLYIVDDVYVKTAARECHFDVSVVMYEQLGIALENEHGVLVLLPIRCREYFECLGEF